jgi:catechol 2,3-dioxygenase-like lactoylglutathione lyase family enzyme
MELGRLRQIILTVKNMNEQVIFYRDTLGLKVGYPHKEDYSEEFWVQFETGECSLCLHAGGRGELGKDAPRFTFEVKDIKAIKIYLEEKGLKVTDIRQAAPGKFVCDFHDPEGNVISAEDFGENA